jgi:hypothetical protein
VVLGDGTALLQEIHPRSPFKSNRRAATLPLLNESSLRRPGTVTRPDPLFVCYLGSPTGTPIDYECGDIVAGSPTPC